MFFRRDNFKRTIDIHNFGSQRAEFNIKQLSEIEIPLPGIEVQREYVAAYRSLQQLAEQNEALAAPLQEACNAFVIDCKEKYQYVKLGELISECTEKNRDYQYAPNDARGVYCDGTFGDTRANLSKSDLSSYKVVHKGDFAYSNRINIGSIALNLDNDLIVSPSYTVFRIESNKILEKYLFILFRRKEFLRSTLFFAIGTIKDEFTFENMKEVKIPLPPIEVQRSIVALYNCAEEARAIAKEAREQLKILAPAMVQRAANTPVKL